jgi:hypothetical protein
LTQDTGIIEEEGRLIEQFGRSLPDILALHRLPPWKPRTNPADWHGLITSDPRTAIDIIAKQSGRHANVAIELGDIGHAELFASDIAMGWIGSRNHGRRDLAEALILHDRNLPIAVKNSLDGDIGALLEQVGHLRTIRDAQDAPLIPMLRGGSTILDENKWAEAFKLLSHHTKGRFIVDVAHDSGKAHDTDRRKTDEGQERALSHTAELVAAGHICIGVMAEASSAISPTDPNMNLGTAMRSIGRIRQDLR